MTAEDFARFSMIGLGLILGLAFGYVFVFDRKRLDSKLPTTIVGIGTFALIGVGGFGPSFLGDYSKFLKDLGSLQGGEQEERYAKFVSDMGSGKMPEKYQPLVKAYMLEHPSANFEATIEKELPTANAEGRESLLRLQADFLRKQETATLAAKAAVEAPPTAGGAPAIGALDSTSILLLSKRPEPELKAMKLDQATLNAVLKSRKISGMVGP